MAVTGRGRRWVAALAVLTALAAGACGDDGGGRVDGDGGDRREEPSMDVTEALEELRGFLDRTVAAVAATGEVEVLSDSGPVPCQDDATGAVTDEQSASVTIAVPVEAGREVDALDAVVAHWEAEGVRLDLSRRDGSPPEVLARGDAFGVSALAVAGSGQVSVMGATDCLEAAGG